MRVFGNYVDDESINPDRLYAARVSKHYEIEEVAAKLEIEPLMLEMWEEGIEQIPFDWLKDIAFAVDCHPHFLTLWPACPRCNHIVKHAIPESNSLVIHALNSLDSKEALERENAVLKAKIKRLEKSQKENPQ